MKKLRRFIFCLMLSSQIASGLFPVIRTQLSENPPIQLMEENPFDDSLENN
ncbi:MAG: hypothetical protein J6J44_14215 [Lachnospiraceae bacterium]|nr:hypothetical protein [Lachnospiraceae bacterium]